MKLTDLDPRWLMKDGQRVGFIFRSPTDSRWYQSCFAVQLPRREQWKLFSDAFSLSDDEEGAERVQGCTQGCQWNIAGGIETATFETMTVTPSLDGSPGGLWHGFVTEGQIVGGI